MAKRFLIELKKECSNFVFKIHPESILSPPIKFLKKNNIKIETMNFDKIFHKASIFIIDFATTPIKSAIFTKKPIIIIEHEFCRIPAHIRQVLEQRCAVLSTSFKNNQITTNLNKLSSLIKLSKKRSSNTQCLRILYNLL